MATNFPTSLDTLTNPATSDQLNSPSHATQHANANDAIEALEAKVGINNSALTTSLEYRLTQVEGNLGNSSGDFIPLSVLGQPSGPAVLDADGNLIVPENKIIIEGATADAHELTLQAPDVTSDITVTLPNFSGTLATTVDVSNLGALKSNTTNPSFVINGSPTVFEPSWSAATFTGGSGLVIITSTQIATYPSNHFAGDEIQFNFGSGSPWFNANGTYTIISHFTSGGSQEYFYLSEFNFIPQSGYETTSYAGPSSIWFNVYPDSKNISSTEIGYLDGVTSGIQNQINLKSNIDSPTFTGTPLAPTASAATNTTQIATTEFVKTAVNNLVNSAPNTLDTLNELATALGNDANFATTTATSIGNKVSKAGGDVITSSLPGVIGLTVKGMASQTANLQEWQQSDGTANAFMQVNGNMHVSYLDSLSSLGTYLNTGYNEGFRLINRNAAHIPLKIIAAASQTADLQQWQNSAGTVLAKITSTGDATLGYAYVSGLRDVNGTGAYLNMQSSTSGILVNTRAAANIGLIIKGAASQTANLQEWQNSSGTVTARFTKDGEFFVTDAYVAYFSGASNYSATLNVQTADPTYAGLVIRGRSAQTGDLQEWQNSAGTVLAKVDSTGAMFTTTAAANTNTTQVATTSYVQTELADLVNSAPATLDTLKELSDALGADANFATTVTNNLALKAPLASPTLTGTPAAPTATTGTNSTQIATTAFVKTEISNSVQPGAVYQTSAPSSPAVGQIWIDSDENVTTFDSNIIRRKAITATAGQTVFTADLPFIDGFEQIFMNGLLLVKTTDYATSNSNTVTLTSAAAASDVIEIVSVTGANSIETYTQAEVNALLAANTSVAPLSISANTTLLAKKRYFVTSASALTLTLPASPVLNDEIQIVDASGNSSTYNIAVARNGRLINGNAGNLIIDMNGAWTVLVYTGVTYGWKVG